MPQSAALSAPDLAAYLARIGYDGAVAPTRAALNALHLLHPQAIPFENLDPLSGRTPPLDLPALVAKLVQSRRGGYCFEQNTLFKAVLEAFGFKVVQMSGRVMLGKPEEAQVARTHKVLRLTCEGQDLLCDIGLGGQVLTGPMRLVPEIEQQTPHEPYRLDRSGEIWWLRAKVAGEWRLIYRFTLDETWPIDDQVANHYVATHPASHFTYSLIAARVLPKGRLALLNRRLTEHRLGEPSVIQEIADGDALRAVLAQRFGIELGNEAWAKAAGNIAG
ncbi:arylamine N-acetyltransferase family protein [Bosea psychrotolerans]|uniref:N-hydroxyarylamine O-acetyltransferase n=1 Tax=Bosea psychrotolerans TaxID=1871628 RepID=A0A2S4MI63_9HYPH|nr:arylamine N-acetyltransferase [Bosea psychrotolerans]POR54309.1 N-hydroxyarylamine O-acetyltransferase [Bosea psychrotolerans]